MVLLVSNSCEEIILKQVIPDCTGKHLRASGSFYSVLAAGMYADNHCCDDINIQQTGKQKYCYKP